MTPKFAIPLVFALSTSTAVFAQDTTTQMPADDAGNFNLVTIPFDWDEDTIDAFFSDPETGELRDEDEISENWDDLDEDQQDIVRQYCDGVGIDAAGMNGATVPSATDTMPGATTGTDTGLGGTTGTDTDTGLGGTTGTDAPGAGGMGEQQMAPAEGTTTGVGEAAPAYGTTMPGADPMGTPGGMETGGTAPQMVELCEIIEDL